MREAGIYERSNPLYPPGYDATATDWTLRMVLTTTPELLRELATLYKRIAELEQAGGLRPGEGAPAAQQPAAPAALEEGLHAPVAELSEAAIAVLTPTAEILYISPGIERLLGYRPEEVVGRNAWTLVHDEDLASVASARSAPLDDGIPIEVRSRCRDGSYLLTQFTARPWPAEAPRFIVARFRASSGAEPAPEDAARLTAEYRRAAALARVSQLALGLPEAGDVLDAAVALAPAALGLPLGAYLEPCEGGLRVRAETGFPAGVRGRTVPTVMTLAGLAHAGGAPASAFDLPRDGRLADPLLEAAGATCALAVPVRGNERVHGVLVAAGRKVRHFDPEEVHFLETVGNVLATAMDGRAAQEALRGRERLARAVFEHARDGLAVVDEEGRCTELNAAAERILGVSFEALRGRRPADVIPTALDLTPRARPHRGEATVATPSGPRGLEWEVIPGILPGVALAVLRDVTERREMLARLALADRLISVGTLAAGVAHELSSPLGYLSTNLNYLSRALREAPVPAAQDALEALDESVEGAGRLRAIVDDLRTFVRTPESDAGPADLEAVLRSCVGMAWSQIRYRARLEREVGPLPLVAGNPARLAQVFVNLLVNAAQAVGEGDAQSNVIRLAAQALPDGRVAVEVTDSGAGISAAVLPHIFEPFFTTKPANVGTGLGLSICRSIVQGLGGTIEVKSQPGRGSTFRVALPVAEAPAPGRRRLLLVCGEQQEVNALRAALAAEHEVVVFGGARIALERLEQGERFDAVLCDVAIPERAAVELHAELLRLEPALAERLVFLAGPSLAEDVRRELVATRAPILGKPLSVEALRATLARLFAAERP
jgi:PAS domain S-box-containing protein